MSLQDKCGHLAKQCGVVNFVSSYLPPMKGQSRVQLILVYFDKLLSTIVLQLIIIIQTHHHHSLYFIL